MDAVDLVVVDGEPLEAVQALERVGAQVLDLVEVEVQELQHRQPLERTPRHLAGEEFCGNGSGKMT